MLMLALSSKHHGFTERLGGCSLVNTVRSINEKWSVTKKVIPKKGMCSFSNLWLKQAACCEHTAHYQAVLLSMVTWLTCAQPQLTIWVMFFLICYPVLIAIMVIIILVKMSLMSDVRHHIGSFCLQFFISTNQSWKWCLWWCATLSQLYLP